MSDDFVHLHTHSDTGSLLDGFGKLDEYVGKVVENGQPGLGLSDHGTGHGLYTLLSKARSAGITPVPGVEFYVAPQNPEGAKVRRPVFYGANGEKNVDFDVSSNGAYTHQTIWAINNTGLTNLFKLLTLSNDPERYYSKPRIDFDMLAEHSEGLVVATGCPSSEISTRFLMGQDKQALDYANRLKEIFGDRLFVELMDHSMSIDLERRLLPKLMGLSRKLDLPLLATNDAHYTLASENVHHEEMLCSQSGSRMSDETWDNGGTRFAFNGNQYYLKTASEMLDIFPKEDFPGAVSNTLLVAEMAQDISMSYNPSLRPQAFIPPGETEVSYFKRLIEEGFEERYGNSPRELQEEARSRIAKEFQVIHSSDFIGYFLTVYEYIDWTRQQYSLRSPSGEILALPVGVGRGSVGGSIIAFLLRISETCPIRHGLFFERFLSDGRGDTYEIVYDDGSREEVVVSESRSIVLSDTVAPKYIHELRPGDEIVAEETDEPIVEVEVEEVLVDDVAPTAATVPFKLDSFERKPEVETEKRVRLDPIRPEDLTDLSVVPF